MKRHFITVEWCKNGKRGIFCDKDGGAYSQEDAWSKSEMWEILGAFAMILSPQSRAFSEEEIKQYHNWIPLAEYQHAFGIALQE